jgi:aminoglycoside phosphotransferase (APT) family kinase protein
MEPIDGANPTVGLPQGYLDAASWRHELGLAMADGAASVGAVDHEAVGLADLGRAEGYLERQVARWRAQLDSYSALPGYPGPDIPGVDEVGEWLDANRPTSWAPGLIHGDYHLANVLCSPHRPGLAAIVDWELTTIGDPLLDLGWLLATWPDGEEPDTTTVQPWDGFPTPDELVRRYGERSDRDLSAVAWYEVLACYKLGLILEGTHARAFAGLAPDETGDRLHASTVGLFRRALTGSGGRERRDPGALLAAAERLFADEGIDGPSLREITRAAGQRNTSALQYHFGDRDELLRAVLERHLRSVDTNRSALLDQLDLTGGGDQRGLAARTGAAARGEARRCRRRPRAPPGRPARSWPARCASPGCCRC